MKYFLTCSSMSTLNIERSLQILGMIYEIIAFCAILLFYPITLDFIIPFESLRYVILFSINQTIFIDILRLNYTFVMIFAILSITCTESTIGLYSYHISMLFKIIRWVKLYSWQLCLITAFTKFLQFVKLQFAIFINVMLFEILYFTSYYVEY